MDERTLNDLLECSVCLERLDTSSKVLPCQHTFCRKCLEVIVTSRQELRCPECRILVDVKIDELPPNVLLMRILEGMKNASQNQNNSTKSPRNTSNNTNSSNNTGFSNHELSEGSKIIINEQPIRASNEQNARRIVPHTFALHDFVSKEIGDLNFKKGDIILLKKKLDTNWFIGELNGREGAFPINYVQIIVPLPVPQCIALYDFKMGPNEEEGCLTFKKSTIINVLRRVDHNWAEGRIGSCIGIFPIAFVEMNSLAKQLLESGNVQTFMTPRCLPPIPFDNNSSDTSSTITTSPNSTCSSNTSNSVPSSPTSNSNSPQNNTVRHRDMKEKRHSLNALTANTSLSIVQTHRHSAEILSVPDNESAVTLSTNSENSQQITSPRSNDIQAQQQQIQHQNSRANVLKSSGQTSVPNLWAYVALYPYKPRKTDELELKKGCVYFVTERCLDGWYKGKNWADKSGVFPGNYVTPLRNRDQQQLIHQRKTAHNSNHSQHLITVSQNTTQSNNDYANTSIQPMPPPELPPRSNTTTPSSSVWTKPLGHHVEAFFNRKSSTSQHRIDKSSAHIGSKCSNSVIKESSYHSPNVHQQTIKEKDKKESSASSSAVSLMKRLTNIKRSKSPPHSNQNTYSMDNPVFEDTITSPAPISSKHNVSVSHPVHVRSGSCPSQLLQSLPIEMTPPSTSGADPHGVYGSQRVKGHKERTSIQAIRQQLDNGRIRNHLEGSGTSIPNVNDSVTPSVMTKSAPNNSNKSPAQQVASSGGNGHGVHHRKSQSLDANTISSQITGNSPNSKSHGNHIRESRFRCIVSYPPNSDVELELNVGDIVFVHRKQKNGWFKGTHARTNKTGLFPASFVEPDI